MLPTSQELERRLLQWQYFGIFDAVAVLIKDIIVNSVWSWNPQWHNIKGWWMAL